MEKRFAVAAMGAALLGLCAAGAPASIIGYDSFLQTAAGGSGYYQSGASINTQAATVGTAGYASGSSWNSGTGAFDVSATPLTNPATANPASGSTDGSLYAIGNANARSQYRALATIAIPANQTLYFSELLQESSNSYTGAALAGFGAALASGANSTVPSTGVNFGFSNGALTMFYNNGGTNLAAAADQVTLIASPTAGATYLAEAVITGANGSTATVTPKIYNASGVLVLTGSPVSAMLATSDFGQFQGYVSSTINNGSPAQLYFDEFRLGTAESDVVVTPEPASLGVAALGALGLLARRRRR